MESAVEEIKKKLDIVDFISAYTNLKKTGRNFKANCPFHQENTPSFVVSPDRQIWHCFGACQDGGDIFKFLMKSENITFPEALKELAEKANVKLTKMNFSDPNVQKKEKIFEINSLAAEFFEYILQKSEIGNKARDYLGQRSITLQIAKKFQMGYAPLSWSSLHKFLKKKNYDDSQILESGLIIRSDRGTFYDRFRGRLVFPIKNPRGMVVGFSGRTLEGSPKEAKYINTPETMTYHKRESLYGIDVAKDAIKKEDNVYLVEGEFDVISPHLIGIDNIVAIKGSALTKEQLMYLKRITKKITLLFDSDTAGEEAMKKGIEEAEALEFDVNVVSLDYAKDPDEAVKKDQIKFKKALKNPIPIYDFLIEKAGKKYSLGDPYEKKKFGDDVLGFINRIRNPIILSHYVKKVANILEVSESSIHSSLRNLKNKKTQRLNIFPQKKKAEDLMREVVIQKYLLSFIFQSEKPFEQADSIFSEFVPEDFSIPSYRKICELFLEFRKKNDSFDVKNFVAILSPELKSTFDELFLYASSDIDLKNEKIEKIMYEAKKFSLKRQLTGLLAKDEKESDQKVRLINQKLSEVEKKIIAL